MDNTNFLDKKYQLEILNQCLASYPEHFLARIENTDETNDKIKNIIYLIDSGILFAYFFVGMDREELLQWVNHAKKSNDGYIPLPLTITAKGIDLLTGYSLGER